MQWRIQGGKGGASVPPIGLHLTLRSTDDKLNGTPPLLAIDLRKLLLWLTLECFRRKFVRKQIDWTGRAGSWSQKRSKWACFCPKVGVASKILRALCAQNCTATSLLEILDPPLKWNPLSGYRSKKTAAMAYLSMLHSKINRLGW